MRAGKSTPLSRAGRGGRRPCRDAWGVGDEARTGARRVGCQLASSYRATGSSPVRWRADRGTRNGPLTLEPVGRCVPNLWVGG